MKKWMFAEAVAFCRELETKLSPKYHVAFCGSLLHGKDVAHDLDIMIFPHNARDNSVLEVHEILESIGMEFRVSSERVQRKRASKGSDDTKRAEVWAFKGRKVDVFFPYPNTMRS